VNFWSRSRIRKRNDYGPWIGIAASSLLFGLAHALNPNATVLGLANLSLFGAFLGLCALAEVGLWGACAWHALWNWTDSNLFGLRDSGGPPHPALLVSIKHGGMDTITGGAFGPDGGLIETVVLLLGIGVLALRIHSETRRDQIRVPLIPSP
jgi:membrane protease YdiL (CAAX protease family)